MVDSTIVEAISFLELPFCNKANIVYLYPEVNCLYISNTKIINLGETCGLLFLFLIS